MKEKKKKGLGPTMEGNCQVVLTATIDKLEKVKTYICVSQLKKTQGLTH